MKRTADYFDIYKKAGLQSTVKIYVKVLTQEMFEKVCLC